MDQCTHCTLKGNLEECEKADCGYHDLWYVSALKASEHFNNSTQQLKAKIADLEKSLSIVRGVSHGDRKVLEVIREELRQLSAV